MNNLTKKIVTSPELSKEEREIILAGHNQKIKNLSEKELKGQILDLITKTFLDSGQSSADADVYAAEMAVEIKHYFSSLSFEEIRLAFFKGARNEYGEYFGLNPVTFYKWITSYMQSYSRLTAKKKQLQFEQPAIKELTEEEKDKIMSDAYDKALLEFKTTGKYNDIGNSIYRWLDKKKQITFTPKEKRDFVEIAREKLFNSVDLTNAATPLEAREFKKLIEIYEQKNSDPVLVEAMKLALIEYFKMKTKKAK